MDHDRRLDGGVRDLAPREPTSRTDRLAHDSRDGEQ
jgi:hypothetical protein